MNLVKMITLKNDKIIGENGNKKGLRIKEKKKKNFTIVYDLHYYLPKKIKI